MSLFPVLPNREAYFPLVLWVPYVAGAAGTATTTVVRVQLLTEVAFTQNRKVFFFFFSKSKKKRRIREIKDFLSHLFLNFLVKHRRFFLELSGSTQFWNLGFGFPGGSVVKHLPTKQETGLIPGLGKSPGEENGNPLQYPCLGNPIDRGAWWATDHGAAKSQTRLSD